MNKVHTLADMRLALSAYRANVVLGFDMTGARGWYCGYTLILSLFGNGL